MQSIPLTNGQALDAIDKLANTELGGHLMNAYLDGRMIVSTVRDPFVYQGLRYYRGMTFAIDAGVVLDYSD